MTFRRAISAKSKRSCDGREVGLGRSFSEAFNEKTKRDASTHLKRVLSARGVRVGIRRQFDVRDR